MDVAYKLRCDLFEQCNGNPGPAQFTDMATTFSLWKTSMALNLNRMSSGGVLKDQLMKFRVFRKPGKPVV
ncbi:hypothetical protein D3C86_2195340 [compost metagenome]